MALAAFALLNLNCQDNNHYDLPKSYRYLALGDSYTIGESVAYPYNFPSQLKDSLVQNIPDATVSLEMVATTGWTTGNLIQSLAARNLPDNFDIVTLLIGVNNQYQHLPFSVYESEFPQLVNTAVTKAGGDRSRVIVISIPDYAYTPYGQSTGNAENISAEIAQYNAFARQYCAANGIAYVSITDITQQGLNDTALVAFDGLHPSAKAYIQFTERLLPVALEALGE